MPASPFHIRRATPTDLPAVYSFELAYIQEIEPQAEPRWRSATPALLRQWTENLPRMFIAEREGQAAGHCFWQAEGGTATLASLYVAPAWRRQGLGAALLAQFERDAAARGFAHLALGVYHGNPAQRTYERAGYQPTHSDGTYGYYEKRLDA